MRYSLLTLALTLAGTVSAWAGDAEPQGTEKKSAADAPSQPSLLLAAIASIPEWASKLEAALRAQGADLDKRKAMRDLIPDVTAIQKNLSDLETLNNQLVDQLAGNAPNKDGVQDILLRLANSIQGMSRSFSQIRQKTQILSSPDLVDLERAAESAINTKGTEVKSMLDAVGYANGEANAKQRSSELLALLHGAEDAFLKLHQSLEK